MNPVSPQRHSLSVDYLLYIRGRQTDFLFGFQLDVDKIWLRSSTPSSTAMPLSWYVESRHSGPLYALRTLSGTGASSKSIDCWELLASTFHRYLPTYVPFDLKTKHRQECFFQLSDTFPTWSRPPSPFRQLQHAFTKLTRLACSFFLR